MKLTELLSQPISQAEFAELIGVSEARVSQLVAERVIVRGDTAAIWLTSYCERLRDMAAGRASEFGGLDLVQERAALARSQREGQDIKNAVARGMYAPIELLSDVLATAAQSVVDRFDQIPSALRKVCPDLPQPAYEAIMRELASARNEMVRKTESLLSDALDESDLPVEDEAQEVPLTQEGEE